MCCKECGAQNDFGTTMRDPWNVPAVDQISVWQDGNLVTIP